MSEQVTNKDEQEKVEAALIENQDPAMFYL